MTETARLLREVEEQAHLQAIRLAFIGKLPYRLLATYASVPRTRCGVSLDPYEPISSQQQRRLRERWPNAARLQVAFKLGLDVEACTDLLAGRRVDPSRLDADGVAWARSQQLVSLAPALDALGDAA